MSAPLPGMLTVSMETVINGEKCSVTRSVLVEDWEDCQEVRDLVVRNLRYQMGHALAQKLDLPVKVTWGM